MIVQETLDLFSKLRPAFKLPDRRALACSLLLAVFMKVQEAVQSTLGKRLLAITSDGWSRSQGAEHVVNFCANQLGVSVFMDMATCHSEKLGGDCHVLYNERYAADYNC